MLDPVLEPWLSLPDGSGTGTPQAGRRLLDNGCGDGTFLALVHDLCPEAVGADIARDTVDDCAARFAGLPGISFVSTDALAGEAEGSFGVGDCMEVLEHCTGEQVGTVLSDLRRLVAHDGTVVISVPIEIGLSLIGKHLVRAILRRRRYHSYEYSESYTCGEFWGMVFAGEQTAIERPRYTFHVAPGRIVQNHGHKGFRAPNKTEV